MTEKQPYEVTKSYKEFELRHYPAGMQIETIVQGDFVTAGSRGFRPLVNFISGNNNENQSIAMTAPVIQQPANGSGHSVRFVLPTSMDAETAPAASDSQVKVIEVPAHNAAARRFSGSWNEERFEAEGETLLAALAAAGLATKGSLYFSRFDPPWKPGFLKRNEVLIQVKN